MPFSRLLQGHARSVGRGVYELLWAIKQVDYAGKARKSFRSGEISKAQE